jgi:hypothetical protein
LSQPLATLVNGTRAADLPPGVSQPPSALAESEGARECLQFFTREKRWINERHLEVCRIPAPAFQEQDRATYLARVLNDIGAEAQIDRAGNVTASFLYQRGAPFVALAAHMDTVLAPRLASDVALKPNGRMEGPGVSDNGAGLAALLAVARALKTAPPLRDCTHNLLLAATVGEEGEGNLSGMRYLCRQSGYARRVAAFLVLDGAGTDHITTRALGSRRFEVALSGPGGHSWSDFGAANPVLQSLMNADALKYGSRYWTLRENLEWLNVIKRLFGQEGRREAVMSMLLEWGILAKKECIQRGHPYKGRRGE